MLRKVQERWNNMRLANKMLLSYLLLLSVMCCIIIVTISANLSTYDGKLYEKSIQELDFFVQKVNSSLSEVETFSYNIALSMEIQQKLSLWA